MSQLRKAYEYNFYNARDNIFFSTRYGNHTQLSPTENYLYYTSYVTSPHASYLQDAAKLFFDINNFNLYPMAVRYTQPQLGFYVIERPPFKLRLDFSNTKSYRSRKQIKLLDGCEIWVPWTVSVICLNTSVLNIVERFSTGFSFSLYFNDGPLSSFDDLLLNTYLPNASSGYVCLGQDALKISQLIKENPSDISSIYNQAFADYFAGWNSDLEPTPSFTPVFNSVLSRIASSKKPPAFSLKKHHEWPYNKTIEYCLKVYSEMSLEETLTHVNQAKTDRYSHHISNSLSKILEKHSIFTDSDSFYNLNYNSSTRDQNHYAYYSYLKGKSLNSLFLEQRNPIRINSKYSLDDSQINDLVSNPYIISQIYKSLVNEYHKNIEDRQLPYLSFDFDDICQYTNSSQEVFPNVISS